MQINVSSYIINGIFHPNWDICSEFYPIGYTISTGSEKQGCIKCTFPEQMSMISKYKSVEKIEYSNQVC